jgi:hypothetical protein
MAFCWNTSLARLWNAYGRGNPAMPWVILFLFLSLIVSQRGGTNAYSRFAALRAATEAHTLHIDDYRGWTDDWSRAPNGHYYSNKAPGAFVLGLPAFALVDVVQRTLRPGDIDAMGRLPPPRFPHRIPVALTVQLVPFAVLVLVLSRHLVSVGAPLPAVHFFALAALFGNTAAIYMNSYLGHGLAALLFLAAFYDWLRAKWLRSGALMSWCLLTDYGVLFVLPAFALATLWRERSVKPFVLLLLGAVPAAIVWGWYHTAAFGSPLALASGFSNPDVMHPVAERGALWGTYSFVPYPEYVWKLLFGQERGILPTQPWILVALPLLAFAGKDRALTGGAWLLIGGFAGLLWMNAGFGGWHGGGALGPRYLCLVFPAIALMVALIWRRLPPLGRSLLWGGLAIALAFRWLVFPFPTIEVPVKPLWAYFWGMARDATTGAPYLRLTIAALAAVAATVWACRARRV